MIVVILYEINDWNIQIRNSILLHLASTLIKFILKDLFRKEKVQLMLYIALT